MSSSDAPRILQIDETECNQMRPSPDCEEISDKTSRSSSVRSLDSPVPATTSPVPTIHSVRSLSRDAATNVYSPSSQVGNDPTRQAKTDSFPRFGGKPGRPPGWMRFTSYSSAYNYRPQCTIKASSANGVVVAKGEHAYAFCDVEHGRAVIETLDRKIAGVLKKTEDTRRKLSGNRTRYLRDRNLLKQLNELREFRKLPKLVFNPPQRRGGSEVAAPSVKSSSATDAAMGSGTRDLSGSEDDSQ
ncbi:unnamed protein product [Ixodes hexagonus]